MNAPARVADSPECRAGESAVLSRLRASALAAAALALVFAAFFQASKHVGVLAAVNPFAEDPYGAVGSFAVQAALLLAAVSVVRVWWPGQTAVTAPRTCGIVRTQFSVVSAVVVTLVAYAVALARHVEVWFRYQAGLDLASAVVVLGGAAVAAGFYILRGGRGCTVTPSHGQLLRGFTGLVVVGAVLWVYPEAVRASILGALVTVVVGAVVLFVPMAELSLALVPYSVNRYAEVVVLPHWLQSDRMQWVIVVSTGVVAGGFLATAEALAAGGGSMRVAAVAAYLGLETVGVAIGFAMLRGPLGLRYP